MRKNTLATAVLLMVALLSCLSRADDKRIYYLGNSLTDELKYDSFVKLAAAGGHKITWGRQMIPGAPIHWLWDHPKDGFSTKFGYPQQAFVENEWDIITLQPFSGFEVEYAAAEKFIRLAAAKSPNLQVYIYAQWPGRRGSTWVDQFAAPKGLADQAALEKVRKTYPTGAYEDVIAKLAEKGYKGFEGKTFEDRYEVITAGLREMNITTKPVKMIPAGYAMKLLDQKMQAGLVPGYKSAWDLYSDGIHVSNVGSYLVATSYYATIFATTPVGLPVGEYQAQKDHPDDHFEISPELAKTIQETVWEVVATHPLTGVKSSDPLKVATPSLAAAVVGEPYRFDLQPAFGEGPYKWNVAEGTLPAGLAMDAAGTITGTPTADGSADLKLQVADAKGATASRSLQFLVQKDTAPRITTAEVPAMTRGTFARVPLEATDGNGAINWTIKSGKLPGGLVLDSGGILIGAPGEQGTFEVTLQAADADAGKPETAEKTVKIEVKPAGQDVLIAPYLAQGQAIDGKLGQNEWKFATVASKVVEGENPNNTVAFDVAFDKAKLYVAVRVLDDKITGKDAVEIYLDGLNNREATYNFDDRRIILSPDGNRAKESLVGVGYMVASRAGRIEGGYLIEFSIERKNLARDDWGTNSVVGVDIANVDDDGDGKTVRVVWQGTKDNATNPSQFGTVILGDAPAEEPKKGGK